MNRPRALLFTPCCLIPLLLLNSCSERPPAANGSQPDQDQRADDGQITVQGITEIDGQTLLELPIGSSRGITSASFFRVYDPEQQGVIKCMLKVKEVLGPQHCVAVVIGGLFDVENPIAIGDPVYNVDDLALIGGGYAVEREVRLEQQKLDLEDAQTQAAFDRLRENYQRRLREIVEERDVALAELQAKHERQFQQQQREHERALAQKDLERRSDLTALRTTMLAEATREVQQARKESRARVIELERERDELQAQVDALIVEQNRLLERVAKLVEREAEARRQHQAAIRAEVETREILEARLAQIERNLTPPQRDNDTTLTNDTSRSETVLERLERITGERDTSQRQVELLQGQITQLQQQLELAGERLTTNRRELELLRGRQGREGDLAKQVSALQQNLEQAKEHLDAASLARLESERQYYELMLRVLRLPDGRPEQLRYLKDKLRQLAVTPADLKAKEQP